VLCTQPPRRGQRVEKVGVELIATTNRALKAPKRRVWYPICGESGHKGSFSTASGFLGSSLRRNGHLADAPCFGWWLASVLQGLGERPGFCYLPSPTFAARRVLFTQGRGSGVRARRSPLLGKTDKQSSFGGLADALLATVPCALNAATMEPSLRTTIQTSPLNVRRTGGVTIAENRVSTRPPIARKPRRHRVDEGLVVRFLCHANFTHVLQTLWRGLHDKDVCAGPTRSSRSRAPPYAIF
jgi:hypothetical protein